MKIAFLLGSFIRPYPGGSGSSYTVSERIEQTHKTISSIRLLCPTAKIIFIEGSDEDITPFNFDYDILVRPTEDDEIKNIIYSNLKSIGECVMLIYASSVINLQEYDLIFKISGRYQLTSDFNLENFSQTKFSFYDHTQWGYETTLYSFPGKLTNVWLDALKKSLIFMNNQNLDSIEVSMRYWLNVKHVHGLEKLGIEGYNAPIKRHIKY